MEAELHFFDPHFVLVALVLFGFFETVSTV